MLKFKSARFNRQFNGNDILCIYKSCILITYANKSSIIKYNINIQWSGGECASANVQGDYVIHGSGLVMLSEMPNYANNNNNACLNFITSLSNVSFI